MSGSSSSRFRTLGDDALASVVVFLVALPLCLGIAIASGVPPALGLITGIVGGIVVGFLAGSPLQVSGPAAGLTVIIWDLVQRFGLNTLAVIVFAAGLMQVIAGVLRAGRYFQAVPPSLIHGMLAGIGVLIFCSQFHVMVDDSPRSSGLANLISIPESIWKGVYPSGTTSHHLAALIGIVTIGVLLLWNRFAPKKLRMLPAALIAVAIASVAANVLELDINYVSIPGSIVGAANWLHWPELATLLDTDILIAAAAVAIIASAETLLCAAAVDRMHDGPRTQFDRELAAQGVGNVVCGIFGALPMTGVVVRSSANLEAGGKTRLSAILHGVWLLALVVAAPRLLELIPVASLAAILVFTGYKLVNLGVVKELRRYGRGEVVVYLATLLAIVATDLLKGVMIGLMLALIRLLVLFSSMEIVIRKASAEQRFVVHLSGTATFLQLPRLVSQLASVPEGREARVSVEGLTYIDHACIQALKDWERQRVAHGAEVSIPWQAIHAHAGIEQNPESQASVQAN